MFFFGLGVVTLFDSALLAFGNVLFIIGIVLIIGVRKTVYFFARPQKARGSLCFCVGILLILFRHSFIGFGVECVGILQLFGDFFGVIITFLRSLPVVGPLLSHPMIAPVSIGGDEHWHRGMTLTIDYRPTCGSTNSTRLKKAM